mmetsp:Transcript_54369/g.129559  ORF Transcript_54369/g.129559 Transcript_54369/m.129559 type:complete len:134 (-) Transcript_54369:152-553(-)
MTTFLRLRTETSASEVLNVDQPAPATPGAESGRESPRPDCASMTMVHFFFAVAFAAISIGVMSCLGLVARSSTSCPSCQGYSGCAAWQDFRSVLSFMLGALLCCTLTRGREEISQVEGIAPGSEKVQLYAYML